MRIQVYIPNVLAVADIVAVAVVMVIYGDDVRSTTANSV